MNTFDHPIFSTLQNYPGVSEQERQELIKDWIPRTLIYEYDPERKHVLIYESRPDWSEGSRKTAGINRKRSQQISSRMALPKDAGSFWGFRVMALIYKDMVTLIKDEEIVGAPTELIKELQQKLTGKLPQNATKELELKEQEP